MNNLIIFAVLWLFIGVILGIKWEEHNKTYNKGYDYGLKLGCAILFCPLVLIVVISNQVFFHPWK